MQSSEKQSHNCYSCECWPHTSYKLTRTLQTPNIPYTDLTHLLHTLCTDLTHSLHIPYNASHAPRTGLTLPLHSPYTHCMHALHTTYKPYAYLRHTFHTAYTYLSHTLHVFHKPARHALSTLTERYHLLSYPFYTLPDLLAPVISVEVCWKHGWALSYSTYDQTGNNIMRPMMLMDF